MAIKGRQTLYSIFVNGAIPTQNDFRDLIDSGLNRRDDHFFGEWQRGMKYCKGDVVIFDKALYKLVLKQQDQAPCPPEDGDDDEVDDGCYCSTTEPPTDANWCALELDLNDKDWEIIIDPNNPDGDPKTVYQLTANIGIGTSNPQALLDVSDDHKILLNPNDAGNPAIKMEKRATNEDNVIQQYVKYKLSEQVSWESDALAYVFKLDTKTNTDTNQAYSKQTASPTPLLLMRISTDKNKNPQVGIGVKNAEGSLHVHQENRGKMVINPAQHKEPGILLCNLEMGSNGFYFLTGVNNDYTFFTTDAGGGFRFKKSNNDHKDLMDCDSASDGENLVAILGDGRVGIGTEDPKSNLEITDEQSGAIRFQLGNDEKDISNPVISINNLRPHAQQPNTYAAIGVDDDYATFIADTPSGFVFKKGNPYGAHDNEVNINQGDSVLFITPEGKLGIRTSSSPDEYDLDVNGHIRSLTAYLATDSNNINKTGDLKDDDVLDKIDRLRPIKFEWKDKTNGGDEEQQIGFNAQNIYENFPELIKRTAGEKAIAYGNLTAVLVQAIQDQQQMIKDMEERICALEDKYDKS